MKSSALLVKMILINHWKKNSNVRSVRSTAAAALLHRQMYRNRGVWTLNHATVNHATIKHVDI